MGIKKYRYYWKKPKSEITKDILFCILAAGAVVVGGGMVAGGMAQNLWMQPSLKKYPKRNLQGMFSYLRKRGLIQQEIHNHQIYISLSEEGKKKAGIFQLNELKIPRPKKWDKKWRILLFDISEKRKIRREALRGMLKQLGFYPLQKSVWVHAFECQAEMELLKDFFGFSNQEIRLVLSSEIGETTELKQIFNLDKY
ncbi:MAG: hypothetical protein A3D64_00680 [Candidatus Wildermuthbacteria bacterium RIFCSPHIGHO2_02_FULL_49_9]|uniref:Transcriptional repressor PaaX-like central Cas2-like domain-containing protein n=2 Tax=Candidatus Wildermuthiibacteriota TaxID=1817923 RepID=A0A1G2QXG7_9BACT|nr:MAG: hypothetical protein A2672_01475 [Candidatus Wildermuthbacteria bacterium RIFCSPHIGHO2_01_FULL_49_22b]OHA70097.1 MAG: hypothetical protein A3D64_00680 [Candidatus Wildermuthbacteria bacterium RIFCSPHIGHO2_02_FULL_49_9]